MKKLLIVALVVTAIALFALSFTIPIYFYLSGVSVFAALYLLLGFFERGLELRRTWVPLFTIAFILLTHIARKHSVEHELSSFLGVGLKCTHPTKVLWQSNHTRGYVFRIAEDVCYLNEMKEHADQMPPEQQPTYVLQTAKLFRKLGRLNTTPITLFSASLVLAHLRIKKHGTTDLSAGAFAMVDDLTTLLELFPKPPVPSSNDPEELLVQQTDYKSSRELAARLIHMNMRSAERITSEQRAPAASATPAPDPAASLKQRIAAVQTDWNFSEAEMAAATQSKRD